MKVIYDPILGKLRQSDTATTGTNSGGAGGTGRVHIDYAISSTGSSTPTLDARKDVYLNDDKAGGAFLYNFL